MSSDDYQGSSLDDSSSDVSSLISDEHSGSYGRRENVVKQYKITICNNKAPVAFGAKNARVTGAKAAQKAKITSTPRNHATDEENRDQPGIRATQPFDNFPAEEVNPENGTGISEETMIEVGENCPGSYYGNPNNRQQQDRKKGRKWNARPSKVVLYKKGDAKFKWSIKEFLENPEKFLHEMDNNACSLQEEKEDFILHRILPHLEESWGKCFSSNEKIHEMLAKISCSRKSAKVVQQALQLLLHLICKENVEICYENLLVVEAVIKSSILTSEGLFKTDRHSIRELRLYVYSRILSTLVIQQVRKGELQIATLEQDLKKLQKELQRFGDQLKNKKKDGFRYAVEFILEAILCLLKPQDKLKELLDECQQFCSNRKIISGELKVLQGLKKNGKWIDLHCILIYLHGKVYCERPVPQMETERRHRGNTLFDVTAGQWSSPSACLPSKFLRSIDERIGILVV